MDQGRSKEYHLQPQDSHFLIVTKCLKIMSKDLKRDERPREEALEYACMRWYHHVVNGLEQELNPRYSEQLCTDIKVFLRSEVFESWVNIVLCYCFTLDIQSTRIREKVYIQALNFLMVP